MTQRNDVEIDYCPKCRGVWLDRGELDKIIERAAEHYAKPENYTADQQYYGEHKHPHRKHVYPDQPYRKKRSFLNDFFDFD